MDIKKGITEAFRDAASASEVSPARNQVAQPAPHNETEAWEAIPVKEVLKAESRNLSAKIPFAYDKKTDKEEPIDYFIGSDQTSGMVKVFAEIETKTLYLGVVFRKNSVMVFEPSDSALYNKSSFSRESFNEALREAAEELDGWEDDEA